MSQPDDPGARSIIPGDSPTTAMAPVMDVPASTAQPVPPAPPIPTTQTTPTTQPMPPADPYPRVLLLLEGVGRRFPGPPPVDALVEATFSVAVGEHVAIMGPSGSGKSTLLNLIGLLDHPTRGRYVLNGIDASDMTDARRTTLRRDMIGFVFQDFYLMPGRTAWENVALSMAYVGVPTKQRRQRATQALDRVGLIHHHDAMPTTMSGGERQRVAIARALANNPSLLLCDEPTGNLDSATTSHIMELIDELNRDGMTVITITHDPVTASHASRQLTIADGRVRG